jgi:hypothetical protein
MISRRRGQLVLLAAAVVVTALVPMLLAYAQLAVDAGGDVPGTPAERTAITDAKRSLERSVADATLALANGTEADAHRSVAGRAIDRLAPTRRALGASGTDRGVVVDVSSNATAARRWVRTDCPRGPDRVFDECVVTDGVITQTRANSTALVAVAFDITVRGPDETVAVTVVIRGVRGAAADRAVTPTGVDSIRRVGPSAPSPHGFVETT